MKIQNMTEQQFKRAIDEVIEGNGTISVLKQVGNGLRLSDYSQTGVDGCCG